MLMILAGQAHAQNKQTTGSDLMARVEQSTFNKIIASAGFPLVLFEHREPFPGFAGVMETRDFVDTLDRVFSTDETKALLRWAVENAPTTSVSRGQDEQVFKIGLQDAWQEWKEDVNNAVAVMERPGAANQPGLGSRNGDELTLAELKQLQLAGVDETFQLLDRKSSIATNKAIARAHLSYARVELTERPGLAVNSPRFSATNIRVQATATGELWLKLPHISCCPPRVQMRWKKIAQLTVSPKIGTDATITFSVESLKVMATARFDRLFLDYFILREINLAGLGNGYLSKKKFEVYDVSKFVASIPYIDRKFVIDAVRLPAQSGAVQIEVDVRQQ
jgi:hypothetical protein